MILEVMKVEVYKEDRIPSPEIIVCLSLWSDTRVVDQ